ncbi:hypothetical protein VUR80DRAFT_7288 [Thermomyces stellatus]
MSILIMPLPARLRQRRHTRESGRPERPRASHLEALELPELQPRRRSASNPEPSTCLEDTSSGRGSDGSPCTRHSSQNKTGIGAFWGTHVSIVVQPEACRDHLGMLLRQFSIAAATGPSIDPPSLVLQPELVSDYPKPLAFRPAERSRCLE